MELIRFSYPEKFRAAVQQSLLKHEAENNLPLGILANVQAGEYSDQPPYLAALVESGDVSLAVIRTPPYPALFSYRKEPLSGEAVELVTGDLYAHFGKELKGMTASKGLISDLVDVWCRTARVSAELTMAMRIYELRWVNPVRGVKGRLRMAGERDRPLLEAWYAGFRRETMGETSQEVPVADQIDRYLNADPDQRGMAFWESAGQRVSMAGYSGPTPHGIRIGAVYTPPELRKRGYASACVTALSQKLLDQGYKFCFLFTDLQNPTSNHIYQEIGYRPVTDVDTWHFQGNEE